MLANPSQEFSQHSPFQDQAKPKGPVPQAENPTGAGSGTPQVPVDPTMAGWLQPSNPRPIGAPHTFQPPPSSLQGAILGSSAEGSIAPMGGGFNPGNPPPTFDPAKMAGMAQGGFMPNSSVPLHTQGAPTGGSIAGSMGGTAAAANLAAPSQGGMIAAGMGGLGAYGAAQNTGNSKQQWQDFVQKTGATGGYARTHMPELIGQYNQMYGTNAKAGNPNAKGLTDVADFGQGDVDLIHGGDDAWQFLENPDGSPGAPGLSLSGIPSDAALSQTGSSNPLMQAIMQRLQKRQ